MPLTFAPDVDNFQPGVITAGDGLRPTLRGYASYQNLQQYNQTSGWGTLGTVPNSMWAHHWSVNGRIIAGTPTRLYELSLTAAGTFTVTDVSKGGAAYTAPSYSATDDEQDPSYWAYASVGDNLYASNKFTARMQKQTTKAAVFADVAGSPPCSCMLAFRNFLIAGNVGDYGSVSGMKDMVAWSGIGNADTWVPDQATAAGNQRLLEIPGRIVAMRPLGNAVAIYKQNAIWMMSYDGNGITWDFQLIPSKGIGINAAYNMTPPIVDVGVGHIFVGANDIYLFNGQGIPQSITTGTVFRALRASYYNVNNGRLLPTRISHDVQVSDIYFWDYGLVYNYKYQKWGPIPSAEIGIAIATCEPAIPAMGGGAPGVINDPGMLIAKSDNKIYNRYRFSLDATALTFANMNLQIEGGNNGYRTTLQRVVPKFSIEPTGTCTLNYYRRDHYGDTTATADGSATWDATYKRFDLLRNAAWHRLDVGIVSSGAAAELSDMEFVLAPAAKNIESKGVGALSL